MKNRISFSIFASAAILLWAAGATAQKALPGAQFSSQPASGFSSHEMSHTAVPRPPSIIAMDAANLGDSAVTLKEIVIANYSPTHCWLVYGTSSKSMTTLAKLDNMKGMTAVSGKVTGLKPNTTYYFQLQASNEEGTTYGGIQSVKTPKAKTSATGTTPATTPVFTASLN
jgi:phosphodiesterase/alkaline phosphatase D-like protein